MPRSLTYDYNSVVQSAMIHFWQHGYANTTIRDITASTGLKPGSLYAAFENKHDLFVASIKRYIEQRLDLINAIFDKDIPPLERLQEFFNLIIESSSKNNEKVSCMMVNTLLESPRNDPHIKKLILDAFEVYDKRIRETLDEAKRKGAVPEHRDTKALTKIIMMTVQGIRVLNKTNPSDKSVRTIFEGLMHVIKT